MKKIHTTDIPWLKDLKFSSIDDTYIKKSDNFLREKYQRNNFFWDIGSIIHLPQFRRLANKTQVYSFTYEKTRNRLTHSLEVMHLSKQILNIFLYKFDQKISKEQYFPLSEELKQNLQFVLESSCLAHDLGHPPFAHTGEIFLQHCNKLLSDSIHFESNVQNIRILTEMVPNVANYHPNLTISTLDSIIKFKPNDIFNKEKKDIFFNIIDKKIINKISKINHTQVKLNHIKNFKYKNNSSIKYLYQYIIKNFSSSSINFLHPLTYFMNVADDICYLTSDIQDSLNLKDFSIKQILSLLEKNQIEYCNNLYQIKKHSSNHSWNKIAEQCIKLNNFNSFKSQIIHRFILQIENVLENFFKIFDDIPAKYLIKELPIFFASFIVKKRKANQNLMLYEFSNLLYSYNGEKYLNLKVDFYRNLFSNSNKIKQRNKEAIRVLNQLMDSIYPSNEIKDIKMKLKLIPIEFQHKVSQLLRDESIKKNNFLIKIIFLDFITGMTDDYAVNFCKTILNKSKAK